MWLVDVLSEFAESAFQPGVNRGLIVVLHASFIVLLVVLMFLNILLSFSNIHIWILLSISIGLYASITWYNTYSYLNFIFRFIHEVYEGQNKEKTSEKPKRSTTKSNRRD